jgi:uncharacterized protein YgbK (DUF1537 family)
VETRVKQPILGVIADDLTGATDLGSALAKGGMRVVQFSGVPAAEPAEVAADAVVIALKSRSVAADAAVEVSLAALEWLRRAGARQIYFKYCSTFDSTDRGNIGPVAEALMRETGSRQTIFCPAFPENGRTLFQGHLFVGDRLVSETGMKDHPLTPMRDPDLRRVLSRQSRQPVGLIDLATVRGGVRRVAAMIEAAGAETPLLIVDAVDEDDLRVIAGAAADMKLITGAAGVAAHLPSAYRAAGLLGPSEGLERLARVNGHAVILSGSCSTATLAQIERFATRGQVFTIDLLKSTPEEGLAEAVGWALDRLGDEPILIAASAPPMAVQRLQERLGVHEAGRAVEEMMGQIATRLVGAGARRLVVAGGETSGAVVEALRIPGLYIGREISSGVPWTVSIGDPPLALALKSGNFGDVDFFTRAFEVEP